MPEKEETINIDSGLNVSSIQITINLGQPVGGTKTQSRDIEISEDEPPAGTLIRQVLSDELNQKKVRITFVPDDSGQNNSTKVTDPDVGDKSTWEKLLGRPAEVDIDDGITLLRFNPAGGVTTWVPNDLSGNLINHVFQETPHEPGGISYGEFIDCWKENGGDAAAVAECWSRL